MSFFDIDWSLKPSNLELFLAKPNKVIVAKLTEAFGEKQSLKLGNINEITFRIPYKVDIDHDNVDNPHIELLMDRYLILAKVGLVEEWYVIRHVIDAMDEDGQEYKEVTCYLLPYQLNDKLVRAYKEQGINLRQAMIGGTATNSAGQTRQIDGALTFTDWTLGYVDADFETTLRSFDLGSLSVLDFIFKVAESYTAVVIWNTKLNTVSFYKPESVGTNKGLRFSYGKYLKSVSKEINSDEMTTRFKPIGENGLTIGNLTSTAEPYLEDFSYFLYPFSLSGNIITRSSYYMSDELCLAILNHNNLLESHNQNFLALQNQRKVLRGEKDILTKELADLDEALTSIIKKLDIAKSNNQPTVTLESQRVTKKAQVDSKKAEIDAKNVLIAGIDTQIRAIQASLSLEHSFTDKLLKERNQFIIEKEWIDENIFDEQVLITEAKKKFELLRQPSLIVNISIINFLRVIGSQEDHDKINLGDTITIDHERLGINVTAKIIEVNIDWESEDINLTIANTKEIEDDESKLIKMLYNSTYTSSTLDINKWKWNTSTTLTSAINDIINNTWDAIKRSILAGVDNTIEISERGILVRSTDPEKANEYLIIQNGVLAITNDNGNSWKHAITANGIIGERIFGKLIAGVNLIIDATDVNGQNIFTVDGNGVTIAGGKLTITGGLPASALDPAFIAQLDKDISDINLALNNIGNDINSIFGDGNLTSIEENILERDLAQLKAESSHLIATARVLLIVEEGYNYETALKQFEIFLEANFLNKNTYPIPITTDQRNTLKNQMSLIQTTKSALINRIGQIRSVNKGENLNGVVIDAANGLVITRSDNLVRTVLNATIGFSFQKNTGNTWVDKLFYDATSGDLTIDGIINAKQLKLGGVNVLAGNGTVISGQFIDKIKVQQLDATTAKIKTADIETLTVGANVVMGPNARITWSQVLNVPPIAVLPSFITQTEITGAFIRSPTISGALIEGGRITSQTVIDVGTDLKVGNNIYLGQGQNTTKTIIFNGSASISSANSTQINIDAEVTRIVGGAVVIGSTASAYQVTAQGTWNFTGRVYGVYARFS